jgi:hypothetical protein
MWVWTKPDNQTLINFAVARGVSEIFYFVTSNVNRPGTENSRVADLKGRAATAGIKLDALNGDPSWADNGTGTAEAIIWESNAMGTGFFSGAHFDIEPNPPVGTPRCNSSEANNFALALSAIHANSVSRGWHMEEDVQFGDSGCTSVLSYPTLTDAIIANSDEITVMSYRNVAGGGNGMWDIGQDALARAHIAGKSARLGAETNNVSPPNITFYGHSLSSMSNVLSQVDALAWGSPSAASYQGIAIEDYAGYSKL